MLWLRDVHDLEAFALRFKPVDNIRAQCIGVTSPQEMPLAAFGDDRIVLMVGNMQYGFSFDDDKDVDNSVLMVMSPLRPVGWEFKNHQLVVAL